MKYLCLIYENEGAWATMSKEEGDRIMGEYMTFTENITKSGHMVQGDALQVARCVRRRPRSLAGRWCPGQSAGLAGECRAIPGDRPPTASRFAE